MIDPQARDKTGSVTLFEYQNALLQFMYRFGPLSVLETSVILHLNETNKLYEGRDFAVGKTSYSTKSGEQRIFSERWVRQGQTWYTRCTGFVAPEPGWVPPQVQDEKAQISLKGF